MNFNLNKMQCRKRAYMLKENWSWTIVFTDHMSSIRPRVSMTPCDQRNRSKTLKMYILTAYNEPNGPN